MTDIALTRPQIVVELTREHHTLTVEGKSTTVTLSKTGSPGPAGPPGADGQGVPTGGEARQVLRKIGGTDYSTEWTHTWQDFAMNVEYTGTETAVVGGTVYTATIDAAPVYRFVTSATNANGYPTEDSFYRAFDGSVVSDLIVSRG